SDRGAAGLEGSTAGLDVDIAGLEVDIAGLEVDTAGLDFGMAGLDSGATGIDRTSADTRALRVFGLGADEASAAPETAEGSGAAAASGEAASAARVSPAALGGVSLAAALGGVSLVAAGLRRRRRPLPERAASAGAWPLSVWAGAASGGRATEEGAPWSSAAATVSPVARSP